MQDMSRKLEVVDDEMTRVLRGMTGAERLKIASRMFSSARRMIASHLAAEHPDWDQERIERETSKRILSGDQAECVYLAD
jgi:Rv0078B-related antitoxin